MQRDVALQVALVLDVDHVPTRVVRVTLRVIVLLIRIEGRAIGIAFLDHLHDADDTGLLAVGRVEKHLIALLHLVAHHVARLLVANAVPVLGLLRHRLEVIDAKDIGF